MLRQELVQLVCEGLDIFPAERRWTAGDLSGFPELVHEIALAAHAGLTLADVAATIHAHPTLSEALGEAALGGLGRGVHSL